MRLVCEYRTVRTAYPTTYSIFSNEISIVALCACDWNLISTYLNVYFMLALMSIHTVFMSAFVKQCPHCKKTIDTRSLRRVPRVETLRWYQFTPTPHSACPLCGGYVTSTINNSPWLFAPFLLLISSLFLELQWPAFAVFAKGLLGRLAWLAIVCPMLWVAMKKSKLVCEP
jgi:hypothetical protein